MPRVRGIIFDMDGTLVDSRLDFDTIRSEMGLPQGVPILEALVEVPEGIVRNQMLAVMREHELRGADNAVLYEGVRDFLCCLTERGIATAILTRNSRETTLRTFSRLNLSFSLIVTREDALPKPDPEGVHLIARTWGLPTQEIIVIGDYLFDLQAGQRAGSRSVLFAPDELPHFAHEADFVIRHFREAISMLAVLHENDA